MDKRISHINKLINSFCSGHFNARQVLTDDQDEINAMIAGLHMLGQELAARTISLEHFDRVFNTVSDTVLVVSPRGRIDLANLAASELLGYSDTELKGRRLDSLLKSPLPSLSWEIRGQRNYSGIAVIRNREFLTATGRVFPTEVKVKYLTAKSPRAAGQAVLSVKDLTDQQASENAVLRAIIDTQEREWLRLASDLHDSVGQQLSSIKFFVSALAPKARRHTELKTRLDSVNKMLGALITEMRVICFNLMPRTLADFGLVYALEELSHHLSFPGKLEVIIKIPEEMPVLARELEIDLFRVIQEFVSNAIRHGQATRVELNLIAANQELDVRISDNGKGFEPANARVSGMGLKNMETRIRSHNGVFRLNSAPGKSTEVRIRVPWQPVGH